MHHAMNLQQIVVVKIVRCLLQPIKQLKETQEFQLAKLNKPYYEYFMNYTHVLTCLFLMNTLTMQAMSVKAKPNNSGLPAIILQNIAAHDHKTKQKEQARANKTASANDEKSRKQLLAEDDTAKNINRFHALDAMGQFDGQKTSRNKNIHMYQKFALNPKLLKQACSLSNHAK